jgi:integrase/recombinase XerC
MLAPLSHQMHDPPAQRDGGWAVGRVDLAGAAHLELARGVRHLHPEEATFAAMLRGWRAQQQARMLREKTIADRAQVIQRFAAFTNEYPWCWQPAHLDEWVTTLMSERRLAHATVRVYQVALRLFTQYLADARYGWAAECQARFGTHPVPICHQWNTASHASDSEGRPGRRPFTREELQGLFDYADAQVEAAQTRKRKGALAAYRDATVFKVLYAWGCGAGRWSWATPSTSAATRPRRSSAASGCSACATARRCGASRPGGAVSVA